MADAKISALTSLTGAGAAQDDLLAIVDTSAATTKKITREEFFKSVDYISFDTTNVVASPTEGQLTWDTAEKTLSLGLNGGDTVLQLGQETHYRVHNNTGTQIPDGTVVRFSGVLGSSGIMTIAPALADGTYPSNYIIGVTTENISHGADGLVAAFGKVRGIDTSAFAVGDILYASPTVAGGFTKTRPSGSQNIVSVAAVLSSHANNGVIFVRPHVEEEIKNFSSRITLVNAISAGFTPVDGETYFADGVSYIGSTGSTAIPDLPGLLPNGHTTPRHFGGIGNGVNDDTLSVQAAWDYVLSLTSVQGAQFADSDQPALYFPEGHWKSTFGLTLSFSGTGVTIFGDGPVSQLDKISININGSYRANIRNLSLRGATDTGIEISQLGSVPGREYLVEGLRIRDKVKGIHINSSTWGKFVGCFVEKCDTNLLVSSSFGDSFIGCEFSSANEYNIDIQGNGEIKMTDCRAMNAGKANMRMAGSSSNNVVEHYFSGLTCTVAQYGGRSYSISSISNNGSGKLRVTTTSPHEMVAGMLDVGLSGTAYDGTGYDVLAVISPTIVDLDVNFVSSSGAIGNLTARGWDLLITSTDAITNVNDLWFTGCNFNYTKVDGAFNINFHNCRLKEQIWIGDNFGVNRLHFARSGRGRQLNTWSDIPICGPGSASGWSEIVTLGNSSTVNGQEKLAIRMPNTSSGVGSDSQPIAINTVEVMADKINMGVGQNKVSISNSGFGGAMQMLLPPKGQIEAVNTVKAFGRVTWSGADVVLGSQSYNVASVVSEDASLTGRVLITLSDSTTGLDDNLVVVCTPNSGLNGATVQTSLVEDGRIKVNGFNQAGANARIPFSFVVMGVSA